MSNILISPLISDYEIAIHLFDYDPETGILRWKIKNEHSDLKIGSIAGCKGYRYSYIKIFSKQYYIHRIIYLIMTKEWPLDEIHHIDENGFNNRWNNLRAVSSYEHRIIHKGDKDED